MQLKRLGFVATLVMIFGMVALPQAAVAQGEQGNVCVRDYQPGAVCTANDVRIEALTVVSVTEDCVTGTPGETEVVFQTLVSAAGSPDRYDIGLFLALDGGSARDGDSCFHDYLEPPLTPTPTYGDQNTDTILDITDGPWWDGDSDTCGDIESNTQLFKTLPPLRFACIDTNGDGSADVSVCTSWDNNAGTACADVTQAFPGTNSKCSCSGVELGIAPEPAITIVKSPANQSVLSGGTANFSFTVTSKTTISNVAVSDPDCDAAPAFTGGDTNNDSILTPDETWTYTCSKTGVMASFTNTVTVTGTGPLGAVMDTDSANVTVSAATMTLAKTGAFNDASMDNLAQAGETISYSFLVTNTGNVALTNVAVTDPLAGLSAITCPSGNPIPTLAVMASEICTATLTLTQTHVDAGQVDNTASANSNEVGPVMDSASVMLPGQPGLTLVKNGTWNDDTPNGVAEVGETVSYSFLVTNTGNVTQTTIAVTDPLPGMSAITCPSGNPIPSLAPGAMETCTATLTLTQAYVDAGQVDNTASALSNQSGPVMSATSVTLPASPSLGLVKTGLFNDESMDGVAQAGETISYSFQVTNTGNQTLTNIAVTDPMVAPITCPGGNPIPSLAPGAMTTCTGTYAVVGADVTAGQKDNTATAAGQDPGGNPVQAMDSTSTILPNGTAAIGVAKRVTSVTDQGGGVFDIGLAFVVENLGTVNLTNVQITDDLTATFPAPVTFAIQAGPAATGTLTANGGFNGTGDQNLLSAAASTLAVGATGTITLTVRITLNGASGPFSNTATASGQDPTGGPTSDTSDDGTDPDPNGNGDPTEPGENDPTPITVTTAPDVSATKASTFEVAVHDNDNNGVLSPGDGLLYTVVMTNNGTGDALNVSYTDTPDPDTALVVGSVATSQGTVVTGNTAGDTTVAVGIGTLAAGGGTATVTYEVVVADPLQGDGTLQNQGVVSGSNFPDVPTDDPSTVTPGDPTIVPVIVSANTPSGIPTLSEWALLLFSLLLVGVATRFLAR